MSYIAKAVIPEADSSAATLTTWHILIKCPSGVAPKVGLGGDLLATTENGKFTIEYVSALRGTVTDEWRTNWVVVPNADTIDVPIEIKQAGKPPHTSTVRVSRGGGGGVSVSRGKKSNSFRLVGSYSTKHLPAGIRMLLAKK